VSVKGVVQAGPHQNFDSLADEMTYNCLYLARVLDNRVTVTRDPELREKLHRANVTLKAEITPVVQSCNAVRSDASSYNLDAKEQHVKALSGALRDALEVVSAGLAALSEFSYRGIEPDKFNDRLDDLIAGIQAGDARNVADNARYLAGQLSDLDRRQGLEDAKRRLREQTADLLQASKDALKDKDSEEAKNRLNQIVSGMKAQVADLAAQEEAKRRRQQQILKSAGGIGLAMQQMEAAAGNADVADRPKGKAELEKEVERRFAPAMSADEEKRERDLRDMSRAKGVTYVAPEANYPSATFTHTAIPPTPRGGYTAPKKDDDAELNAMLSGLDAPSSRSAPAKSSGNNNNNFSSNDQAELDAMLGGLDAVTVKAPPVAAKPAPAAAAKPAAAASSSSKPSGKKDDEELDSLLNDLGTISFSL
jgi:hypothetical protein